MRRRLALLVAASALASCAHPSPSAMSGEPAIVQAYVDAYNARDLDAMLALMHDEVQWLSVEGSEVAVFADGKPDLAAQMRDYFASPMAPSSEIDGDVTDGRFVAVREIARWIDDSGNARSQSALAVYEIEDGLVRRVWYYPSTR